MKILYTLLIFEMDYIMVGYLFAHVTNINKISTYLKINIAWTLRIIWKEAVANNKLITIPRAKISCK